jgi:hypothetical protein
MRIPSLPFLLCETEHANPNLTYMGIFIFGSNLIASVFMYYYAYQLRFFLAKNIGSTSVHLYTHVLYWVRP